MSEKEQVNQTPTSDCSRHSTQQSSEHYLTTLPTFKKFKNSQFVKCKSKYQKWQCKCKAAHVRSYCKCSPGVIRCVECYAMHHIDSEMQDLLGAQLCIVIFMISLIIPAQLVNSLGHPLDITT